MAKDNEINDYEFEDSTPLSIADMAMASRLFDDPKELEKYKKELNSDDYHFTCLDDFPKLKFADK